MEGREPGLRTDRHLVGKGFNLTGSDKPERVIGARVSADLLQLLRRAAGARPQSSRRTKTATARERVVILSHDFWQRRFGGDPNAIGQTITLNDQPYTVIGVMPRGFAFPEHAHPGLDAGRVQCRRNAPTRDTNYIDVIARLKPGVSLEQAQANMNAVAQQPGRTLSAERTSASASRSSRSRNIWWAMSGRCSSCSSARSRSFF